MQFNLILISIYGSYQRNNSRVYLKFEHGAQFFLPDLQRADLSGQSHDRGVETLVLLLKVTTDT